MDNGNLEGTGHNSPCSDMESINPEITLKEEEDDELLIVDLDDDDLLPKLPVSDTEKIWDEPEPELDFDPGLNEPLYVETRIRGLSKALHISEFIAGVDHLTDEQRERVVEILGGFSAAQLRNWLSWLSADHWTGDRLWLFMESWWQWTTQMRENPKSVYYEQQLSRDKLYEIVNRVDEGDRYDSAEWDDGVE